PARGRPALRPSPERCCRRRKTRGAKAAPRGGATARRRRAAARAGSRAAAAAAPAASAAAAGPPAGRRRATGRLSTRAPSESPACTGSSPSPAVYPILTCAVRPPKMMATNRTAARLLRLAWIAGLLGCGPRLTPLTPLPPPPPEDPVAAAAPFGV